MRKMIIEIGFVNAPLNDRIFFRSLIEFEEFGEALKLIPDADRKVE